MSGVPTPERLSGSRGGTLWVAVVGGDPPAYELRPDELVVLEEACRALDLSDRLAAAVEGLEGDALLVEGSKKQDVVNPLLAELRQTRALVGSLLARLHLPDEPARNPAQVRRRNKRPA